MVWALLVVRFAELWKYEPIITPESLLMPQAMVCFLELIA